MRDTGAVAKLAFRVGPTKRQLERQGRPFVLFADTAWELFHRLTREDVEHYLDVRKSQGFNAVLAVCLPELDARDAGETFGPDGVKKVTNEDNGGSIFYPNRYGELPLLNDDPSTPNEAYFAHIDWVINAATSRGILIILVPTWSRWINTGWSGGPCLFDEDNARAFGSFLGARYPGLPKILGGDSNPVWTDAKELWRRYRADGRKPTDLPLPTLDGAPRLDTHNVINAMAEGILSCEPAAMLSYHPTALALPWSPEAMASAFFGEQSWLSFDGCQSGHTDSKNVAFEPPLQFWDARACHVPLGKMWDHPTTRPVIDLEGHYEGMMNGIFPAEGKARWNEHDVRAGAWQAVCSGALGVVYGHNNVWQMYDPARTSDQVKSACFVDESLSWREALLCPGTSQVRVLVEYLASLPLELHHTKRPAQGRLVVNDAPRECAERDGRVDVLAAQGWLIAHSGQGYPFELDLDGFEGASARWLDPRTGQWRAAGHVKGGVMRFEPPSAGSVERDWVLEVKA